jgi:excisionase family DNA binding protein
MPSVAQTGRLIRAREAAEMLGVSVDVLRVWVKRGYVPSLRFGRHGHFWFRRAEIEELVAKTAERPHDERG